MKVFVKVFIILKIAIFLITNIILDIFRDISEPAKSFSFTEKLTPPDSFFSEFP